MRNLYKNEEGECKSHKLFSKVALSAILLFFTAFASFGQNVIYSCDFEDADENANWTLANGTQTNKWYIGTAANNGGEKGLYISSDAGISNNYSTSSISYVYAYREIDIEETAPYYVEFDWKTNGENNWDVLKAFLIPTSLNPDLSAGASNGMSGSSNNAPSEWMDAGNMSSYNNSSYWQQSYAEKDLEAGSYYLVFFWKNDSSDGSNPPAAIDNIRIVKNTCKIITNLTATDITTESATINWTESGSAESWEVIVSEIVLSDEELTTAVPVTTTLPSYSVTGLTNITMYHVYVRAVCSEDDKSIWRTTTFATKACTPENMCEITYSFADEYDDGWTGNAINVIDEETGVIMASLTMEDGSSEIGSLEVCNDRVIRFEYIEGGYPDEISYEVYDANGEEIFSGSGAMTSPVTHLISCPTCKTVTNLQATDITSESATISWSENGTAQSWNIVVSTIELEQDVLNASGNIITVTDSTYSITGLRGSTTYYVYVRALCSDNDQSIWKPTMFLTEPNIATLPYTCDFEDASENDYWVFVNGTQANKWYIGNVVNNGGENGMYISNDGGVSNTYIGTETRVYAYRDILVPDGVTELALSFDWKAQGGLYNYEFLRVFWLDPEVVTVTAGSNPPNVNGTNYDAAGQPGNYGSSAHEHWLSRQSTWQHEVMVISSDQFIGMGNGDKIYRLHFHWRNTNRSNQPPAAVDNIRLERIINPIVTTVSPSDMGSTSATLQGSIVKHGASDITERGFMFGTSAENLTENIINTDDTDDFSATITGLTPNTTYCYRAYAINSDGTGYGEIKSFRTCGQYAGHDYVDLGLPNGTKWANMNIGAENTVDYGDHFAWGETTPKENYNWETYQYCNGSGTTLTKYCSNAEYGDNGFTDSLITLEAADDAANASWGAEWRMPTHEEIQELIDNCTCTWTKQNGVNGRLFTGRNGNSIFLPAAGTQGSNGVRDVGSYGTYWASSLYTAIPSDAWRFIFHSGNQLFDNDYRYEGLSVRAVYRPSPTVATNSTDNITLTTATLHGSIIKIGTSEVIERGFIYGANPGNLTDTVQSETETTDFSASITGLDAGTTYYYRAYATNSDGTGHGEIKSFTTPTGAMGDHYYVDLGMPSGTKWANTNIGASTPYDYGDYFAWGETSPHYSVNGTDTTWLDGYEQGYTWANYRYSNGDENTLTKYCNDAEYGNNGFTDSLITLEAMDDAAAVNWGGEWRMPTKEEFDELLYNSTQEWTVQNGVTGLLITGYNGGTIFLPAASWRDNDSLGNDGTGCYWSSSLYTDTTNSAWYNFSYSNNYNTSYWPRYVGLPIRPVYKVEPLAVEIGYEPYSCDFEDAEENANWILNNGRQTNRWHIGYAVNNGGEKSLYISNDGGANYTYSTGAESYSYASRKINITVDDKYQFDFDRRIRGESNWDLLRAFLVPDSLSQNLSGGSNNGMIGTNNTTPAGWIDISGVGVMSEQAGWKHAKNKVNIDAGIYYLTFFWKNDGGGGYSPPAAVDNVMVKKLPPFEVTTLVVPRTSTTATLSAEIVVDRETEITQVGFAFGENENQLLDTLRMAYSGTTFTRQMTGLTPQTTYYYRAFAKYDDRTVFGDIVSFRTKSNDTDGTPDNPLTIDNAEEWAQFAEAMLQSENQSTSTYKGFEIYNCGDDTYFKITADIDIVNCDNTVVNEFSGHLNGGGNTFTIRFNEQIGAATVFNAIENATVDSLNIRVPSSYEISANVASYGALCLSAKSSAISNCTTLVSGNKKITSNNQGKFGGFVGNSINNTIVNCTNNLPIEVSPSSYVWVGGIVGSIEGGSVSGCTNNAVIKGVYAGGIAGQILEATLSSNLNAGNVMAQEMAGGIVATITDGNVLVDKCMNIGEIFATNQGCNFVSIGGIVGYNSITNYIVNRPDGFWKNAAQRNNQVANLTISNCANYGSFPALSMQVAGILGNGLANLRNNISVPQFLGVSTASYYYTNVYAASGITDENLPDTTDFFDRQVSDMRNESYRLMYTSHGTGLETTEIVGSALQSTLAANWTYTDGLYPMPAGVPEDDRTTAARIPIYFQPEDAAAAVRVNFTLPTTILGHDVSWVSSNTNVISISDGNATVTRPALGQSNVEVVLTATYEGVTKPFVLMVIPPKIATVYTGNPYVDADSVFIEGGFALNDSGVAYLKEYGFLYSLKRDISDSTKIVSTNLSEEVHEETLGGRWFSYETLAEEFEPGKRYYFAAYATTIDTTTYGSIESFRTAGPPDVIILYPEYRDTTAMEISVDVESDDEDELELTMYWGTDRNNLTEQEYIGYDSDYHYYSAYFSDLQPETKYWFVAEATDSLGTSRSDTVAFYTYGSFIDGRDSTEYKSIIIGNQKWMAENLRYAGNIPLETSEILMGSETEPYRYYPNSDEDNVEAYGYLYNWPAAMNTATDSSSVLNPSGVQGICPNGWHLPSEAEWQELHNELGTGPFDEAGAQMAGNEMFLESSWNRGDLIYSFNFSTSGFRALPAGGYYGEMRDFGKEASFWSTTETIWEGQNFISNYDINYYYTSLNPYWSLKASGLSVRCIKGTTIYAALDTVTICGDEYTYHDTTVTESGDYMRRFYFAEDADTAYCLHLTLNHPPRVELEQTACEVFEWNGETYTEIGDYVQTFVDVNGCDSTVTVHLIDLDDCYGTVSGIISDANTGVPIPNARVIIGTETTRTNTEGEYSLSVLRGSWLMKVLASGYVSHSETIDIQTDTTLNIELVKPQITTNVDDILATTYPYLAHNDSVTISNTSQIPLIWSSVTDYENIELLPEEEEIHRSRNSRALWDSIQTFTTQFNAEQAIATDGFFIYTSSWQRPGEFNRYTPDGEYIETFYIENVGMIRNLSYDGTYFYGTEATNIIFKLDLDNQMLVDSITTDINNIRHCSFNRQNGNLLAGDWNSLYSIDTATGVSTQIRDDLMNVYSSAYDNLSPGGPYLWLFSQTSQDNGPSAFIRQFSINSGEYTDKTHYLDDIELGEASLAGGICASEQIMDGRFILLADVQNPSGNNTIATYEIGKTNGVVISDRKSGELLPNESVTINMQEYTTNVGDFNATIRYRIAVVGNQSSDLNVSVSAIAPECEAVQQLTTVSSTSDVVTLEWQPVEVGDYNSVSYLIFCDNSRFAIDTTTETSITIAGLSAGEHCFNVRAMHVGEYICMSDASNTVCADIHDPSCDIYIMVESESDGEAIYVEWNKPAGVEYFRITRDDNAVDEILYDNIYIDSDVAQETDYCYTITGYLENESCNDISSSTCMRIVPGICAEAPALNVEAMGGSVALSWTGTGDAFCYKVYRNEVPIGLTTENSYYDRVDSASYCCYKVKSACDYRMVAYSNEVCLFVDDIADWTENNLSIYPNPTNDKFFIEGSQIAMVRIYNVAGQLVEEIENNEDERITVNCYDWNPGLYNVQMISSDGRIATRKITIYR
jgi:uncharacterized protein (TIGR02145 family)